MPVFQPNTGMPGVSTEKIAYHRSVTMDGYLDFLAGGVILDGTKTRDSNNSDSTSRLRAGMLLGKITSGGKYTNAVIGVLDAAYDGSTSLTLDTAAEATELVRRVGATGTFTLTGPPTASGTVRSLTITYSAVNTTSGVVTVTAANVNEVQTLNWTNSPSGTFRIRITDYNGVRQMTQPITYSATPATLVSNINTALDAVLASGAVVASGSAVTAIALTFSGTNYAATPQTDLVSIDTDALTAGDVDITRTTTGVDGRFVAGSFVGGTDGSQTPVSFLPDGWDLTLPGDGTSDLPLSTLPIAGNVNGASLLPWPSDSSLKQWVRDKLNVSGTFRFAEKF